MAFRTFLFVSLGVLVIIGCTQDSQISDYRSDIDFLRDTLPTKHPNLFFHLDQEAFEKRLEDIKQKLPEYDELELNMVLRKAVAALGDPHTNFGFYDIIDEKGFFPIEIFWFSDGIWITGADERYSSLIGQKIVAINGYDIQTVIEKVSEVVPANEPYFSHKRLHYFLPKNAILQYYGITKGEAADFTLQSPDGKMSSTTIEIAKGDYNVDEFKHQESAPFFWQSVMSDITDNFFRQKYFEEDSILFIQYNSCWGKELELKFGEEEEARNLPSFEAFKSLIFEVIANRPVNKILFDLRFNGGGSSPQGTQLVEELSKIDHINQPGKLFVAISEHTFSSAVINAMNFRQMTNALLIGTPTGGSPNHYGEVRTLVLPKTQLEVYHSTNYFEYVEEDITAVMPDIMLKTRFKDVLSGLDPIYEYIKVYKK